MLNSKILESCGYKSYKCRNIIYYTKELKIDNRILILTIECQSPSWISKLFYEYYKSDNKYIAYANFFKKESFGCEVGSSQLYPVKVEFTISDFASELSIKEIEDFFKKIYNCISGS